MVADALPLDEVTGVNAVVNSVERIVKIGIVTKDLPYKL